MAKKKCTKSTRRRYTKRRIRGGMNSFTNSPFSRHFSLPEIAESYLTRPLAQIKDEFLHFNKDIRIEILTQLTLHFPPDANSDNDDNPSWIRTKALFKLHKLKMVKEAADEMSDAVVNPDEHSPMPPPSGYPNYIYLQLARLLEDDPDAH
jgi:hypothetical protein